MPYHESPGFLRNIWHSVGLYFWVVFFTYLNKVQIIGEENRPTPGEANILLLSNHVSAIDPFAIAVTSMPFFSEVWWRAPAKEELFKIPGVKQILNTWGAIPVQRGKRDMKSIDRMVALMAHSVVVAFPEGKRSTNGELLPGRAGMGKVIHDARPKVIPIYLHGTDILLPKGKILPLLYQTMTVCYGKPLDLGKLYQEPSSVEVSRQIIYEVMASIASLKKQFFPADIDPS